MPNVSGNYKENLVMIKGIFTMLLLTVTNFVIGQDTLQYGNGYWSTGGHVYIYDQIISKADPKTFKCIDAEYGKDKNHVFFQEREISTIDVSSFQVLKYGYSKDKNHVYYNYYLGKIISGADPSTFEVFDLSMTKDKNYVYYFKHLKKIVAVKNVDATTFHKYCSYFRDKNNLYNSIGKVLLNIKNSSEEAIQDIVQCNE